LLRRNARLMGLAWACAKWRRCAGRDGPRGAATSREVEASSMGSEVARHPLGLPPPPPRGAGGGGGRATPAECGLGSKVVSGAAAAACG
jgi:hypothetical protein